MTGWQNPGKICLAAFAAVAFATSQPAFSKSKLKHIFVIVMENTDASSIYGDAMHPGNVKRAPYINQTLIPSAAVSDNFVDERPGLDSEPHYVWMEAGTNELDD